MRTRDYYALLAIAILIAIYCAIFYFVGSSTILAIQAVVTTVGIFLALFKNEVVKLFIHPDVEIVNWIPTVQTPWPSMEGSALKLTRLLVKNNGGDVAHEVEIQITKIVDPDGLERRDFLPVPLSWTHDGRSRRQLLIKQSAYIDFCIEDNTQNSPRFVLAAGQGVYNYEVICEGDTELQLTVSERNGTKKYLVRIRYQADAPEIKVLSFNELS